MRVLVTESFAPSRCTCRLCRPWIVDRGAPAVLRKVPQTRPFQVAISAFPSAKTWPDPLNSSTPDLQVLHIKEMLSKSTRNQSLKVNIQLVNESLYFPPNISTMILKKKILVVLVEYYLFIYFQTWTSFNLLTMGRALNSLKPL